MSAGNGESSDREIVITRLLDAPPELVFEVWTDPRHVEQWWGPRGFTNTIQEMDVRPGGVWRLIMHGPDGTDYDNEIVYEEVVRPQRLVYLHGTGHEGDPSFLVTTTFEIEGAGTRVTLKVRFESAEERRKAVEDIGAIEGGNQTLDRLAEYLASL
jgi:uncharacterized protein YndB with AHSA1/START domain